MTNISAFFLYPLSPVDAQFTEISNQEMLQKKLLHFSKVTYFKWNKWMLSQVGKDPGMRDLHALQSNWILVCLWATLTEYKAISFF